MKYICLFHKGGPLAITHPRPHCCPAQRGPGWATSPAWQLCFLRQAARLSCRGAQRRSESPPQPPDTVPLQGSRGRSSCNQARTVESAGSSPARCRGRSSSGRSACDGRSRASVPTPFLPLLPPPHPQCLVQEWAVPLPLAQALLLPGFLLRWSDRAVTCQGDAEPVGWRSSSRGRRGDVTGEKVGTPAVGAGF